MIISHEHKVWMLGWPTKNMIKLTIIILRPTVLVKTYCDHSVNGDGVVERLWEWQCADDTWRNNVMTVFVGRIMDLCQFSCCVRESAWTLCIAAMETNKTNHSKLIWNYMGGGGGMGVSVCVVHVREGYRNWDATTSDACTDCPKKW